MLYPIHPEPVTETRCPALWKRGTTTLCHICHFRMFPNSCSWACQGDASVTQKAFHYSFQCYLRCLDSSVVTVILEGCFWFGALFKTWRSLFLRSKLSCAHRQGYICTLNRALAQMIFQMGEEHLSYSIQTHIFNVTSLSYIFML